MMDMILPYDGIVNEHCSFVAEGVITKAALGVRLLSICKKELFSEADQYAEHLVISGIRIKNGPAQII